MLVTIAHLQDSAKIRVLISALKAHGFHPLEAGQEGIAGMPGIRGIRGGFAIKVPKSEEKDAKILANALIAEMEKEDS